YTKIVIEDNGMGIAAEHINDVCKRFFREGKANRTEGVGIGLYLTREIITKQEGYLKIQSREGAGTKVAVYILNRISGQSGVSAGAEIQSEKQD
ncbi:ATP-binding protein, partial [Romboutsia ilealis]|nr:ATP-binding protein [Romboutsia ilealis]